MWARISLECLEMAVSRQMVVFDGKNNKIIVATGGVLKMSFFAIVL